MTSCRMKFRGMFAVTAADGTDLTPKGAKAQALLILLADAPNHRRARRWIESRLWSDRGPQQASGSLRQVLREIRLGFGPHQDLLAADRINIWLEADAVTTDLALPAPDTKSDAEVLEGLDVRDPEFESWLSAFRQRHSGPRHQAPRRPIDIRCQFTGEASPGERLAARALADQIGHNIEEALTAWRVAESAAQQPDSAAGAVGIQVNCELARDSHANIVFARVIHEQTGRVLFSGFREQVADAGRALSDEFITEFAHNAAARCLSTLPQTIGLSRPEVVAAGFANLALRRLYCFDTTQVSEAAGLMGRAFDADQNGVYLAWRGFIRMAQVIDRLEPAGPELNEEVDSLSRRALELSPHNAHALALVALTRMMLFDEVEQAARLAEEALQANPRNLLAHQTLAVAYGMTGRSEEAYRVSRFCQAALARADIRHLWDLYHSLVCISTRRFSEALDAARRATARCPDFIAPHRQVLGLSLYAGDLRTARSELRTLQRLEPGFSLDRFYSDQTYPVDTLRNAGLLKRPITDISG